jgi:predicted NBD/HSP70 family sugar kinase/DNA-binding transcriptional ArsR family regulator
VGFTAVTPALGDALVTRPSTPVTSASIRAGNRRAIIDVLRQQGRATQAELIKATGLSRSTVSSVLSELSDRGLLTEVAGRLPPATGRRPTVIGLNRSAGLGIGIDIGAKHLAVVIGDLSRKVHAERWWTETTDAAMDVPQLVSCIQETMRQAQADPDVVIGAAVSIATPVPSFGTPAAAPCAVGRTGPDLADELAAALQIPVTVENDAALGVLSELTWGPDYGTAPIAYVKWASRVGAGIAIGKSIFRGASGYAGEIGHLTLDPSGHRCWCGSRGCLELYCGGSWILRALAERGRPLPDLDAVVARAETGDEQVLDTVLEATSVLAIGLAHLVNLVNPETVVIGGHLSALGDVILAPLRQELRALSFVARSSDVRLVTAKLGDRASVFGALALVLTEQKTAITST